MDNSNKLELNKNVIVHIVVCAIIFVVLAIIHLVLMFSKPLGNWYMLYIRNPIMGFFYKIFENNPSGGLNIVGILSIIVVFNIILFITSCVWKKMKWRNVVYNVTIACIPLFVLLLVSIYSSYFTDLYTSLIDRYYMKDKVDQEYKEEDLIALYNTLMNKVFELSLEFERDDNGDIIYRGSLEERAVADLLNISDDYSFLKGVYPKKFDRLGPGSLYYNGMTMGVTTGFGIAVDYSSSKAILLNTMTHELCHTKGVMRENEAVYCSFLAGIYSYDNLSQYAAYLEAFMRVDSALYDIDKEMELTMIEPLLKLCINDGFKEICEMYPKMVDSYIKKTKTLEFVSYPLLEYKDHLGELIGIVSSLQEDGGKLYVDGGIADMDYVLSLIDNESYKLLRIRFNNSKELFNRLQPSIKENANLFMAVQQYNDDDYPEKKTREEYLEYYLRAFNNDNPVLDFFVTILDDEYDYSRVVRLLLEYYDGQEILPYEL